MGVRLGSPRHIPLKSYICHVIVSTLRPISYRSRNRAWEKLLADVFCPTNNFSLPSIVIIFATVCYYRPVTLVCQVLWSSLLCMLLQTYDCRVVTSIDSASIDWRSRRRMNGKPLAFRTCPLHRCFPFGVRVFNRLHQTAGDISTLPRGRSKGRG